MKEVTIKELIDKVNGQMFNSKIVGDIGDIKREVSLCVEKALNSLGINRNDFYLYIYNTNPNNVTLKIYDNSHSYWDEGIVFKVRKSKGEMYNYIYQNYKFKSFEQVTKYNTISEYVESYKKNKAEIDNCSNSRINAFKSELKDKGISLNDFYSLTSSYSLLSRDARREIMEEDKENDS